MIKLVIFDLDGTLIDTLYDLAVSVNHILRKYAYPEHEPKAYRRFVGNGVQMLMHKALPQEARDVENVTRLREEFVEYYELHKSDNTHPYEGVVELIAELKLRGIKMAVASNKYHSGTVALAEQFFGEDTFSIILGQREGVPVKPDATIVREILEATSVKAEEAIYVGDSDVDMFTAKNAGVHSVGVTWGLRSRLELVNSGARDIVDSAVEILDVNI